jgi:hypothetical protein
MTPLGVSNETADDAIEMIKQSTIALLIIQPVL